MQVKETYLLKACRVRDSELWVVSKETFSEAKETHVQVKLIK